MTGDTPAGTAGRSLFGALSGRLDVVSEARPPETTGVDLLARLRLGTHQTDAVLRVSRPEPTVAFGRLDTLRPGYPEASRRGIHHGFTPVVRDVGGHAAAYDGGCLVVELARLDMAPREAPMSRFGAFAHLLASSLRTCGVDARVGPVPDEYCPGRCSINARGVTKVVGTAQRVTTRGWILSAVITVQGAERVRAVTTDVYASLGLPFDPGTIGSVNDEVGGVEPREVERAVRDAFRAAAAESAAVS